MPRTVRTRRSRTSEGNPVKTATCHTRPAQDPARHGSTTRTGTRNRTCWRRRAAQGPRSWGEAGLVPDGLLTASQREGRRKPRERPPRSAACVPRLSTLFFSLMEEKFTDSNSTA